MKKLLLVILIISLNIVSANEPVQWKFTATRIDKHIYEIYIKAELDPGWHIYSQKLEEGGPLPTKIIFTENKKINFNDEVKEVGKPISKYEEVFSMEVVYYDKQVTFIQNVSISGNLPITITGNIKYMACNGDQCLPPTEKKFSVVLK